VNFLLDTQVALWAITDSPKLPKKARELIESPKSSVWISAATVWEIAIKHSLGRRDMPVSSQDALRYFRESGYWFLSLEPEHAVAVEDLPAHHADPFDRILVAQAQALGVPILTMDPDIARYAVETIW
jgi:PIN domain nuclease of toxin-antitoxin system